MEQWRKYSVATLTSAPLNETGPVTTYENLHTLIVPSGYAVIISWLQINIMLHKEFSTHSNTSSSTSSQII